jgi:hypothetical protein
LAATSPSVTRVQAQRGVDQSSRGLARQSGQGTVARAALRPRLARQSSPGTMGIVLIAEMSAYVGRGGPSTPRDLARDGIIARRRRRWTSGDTEGPGEERIDGWLLYDFRGTNPIARSVIGFDESQIGTRRWFYLVPRAGEPVAILHAIEPHALRGAPGRSVLYRSWKELESLLKTHLRA